MNYHFAGVIFDIDGTLVDSNGFLARAWSQAFLESGYEVSPQEVRPLVGLSPEHLLARVAGISAGSVAGEKISARRREIFEQDMIPLIHKFPKTRELLLKMRRMGLKLAAATHSAADEAQKTITAAAVEDLIAVPRGPRTAAARPIPEVVAAALAELKLPGYKTVMIGDTPYDVETAQRAGIPIVALRCGGWGDRALRGALAIYDDPEDLWLRFNSSPLASPLAS